MTTKVLCDFLEAQASQQSVSTRFFFFWFWVFGFSFQLFIEDFSSVTFFIIPMFVVLLFLLLVVLHTCGSLVSTLPLKPGSRLIKRGVVYMTLILLNRTPSSLAGYAGV